MRKSSLYQLHRGASKAIWPITAQCYVHTNRAAQQRRLIIMTGISWIDMLGLLRIQTLYLVSRYLTFNRLVQGGFVFVCIGIAFVLSAIYDWAMLLAHWMTFVLFASLCVLTTAIIDYLRIEQKRSSQHPTKQFMPAAKSSFTSIPASQPSQPLKALSHSQSIPQTQVPSLFSFPDTPMPSTPLVRVLETIDLSSTNIKHFLDIKSQTSGSITRMRNVNTHSKDTTASE
ncbi:hypothetical protein [Dictyobacter formicarum]|uniref:Transmembrane protein n=1 Tax=Dictyobacter formicarum TaxID=2778368 RepID=A0ABQ3VPC2_9CHLR|nr:hypothetical protein [Dictyobacter formicarum]GHO86941.1 hypothetical protein KSZ_49470 [Dictyobacter formicarum]